MISIVQLKNISAAYGQKTVLQDVNLTVYDHDFLGIIGPNGGGKTTPVQLIIGLKKPNEEQIKFYRNGILADHISMGFLPQCSDIGKRFPIPVQEVVLSRLGGQKKLFSRFTSKHHHMVDETLTRMQFIRLRRCVIGTLSDGQLQCVLLVRAIIARPEALILDESNTYTDRQFQEQIYQTFNDINRDCVITIVSYDIGSTLQNVKVVACVNHNVHYHPNTELSTVELEQHLGCPINLLGYGRMPHHMLKAHAN